MTSEERIELCLKRLSMGKTSDVVNFSYADTLAYIERLKAENAELRKKLEKATELAYTYRTQDDTLSCSSCPFDSIFDRCKERGLYEDCSKRWKEELLQQAERDLAEERKDENN